MQVLDQHQHFSLLTRDVTAAGPPDRLSLMTMAFEPAEPAVRTAYKAVTEAAIRGVRLTFGVDAYALTVMSGARRLNAAFQLPALRAATQRRLDALHDLSSLPNTSAGIVNRLPAWWQPPIAGRSHMKLTGIGDTFYIGGPNWHGTLRQDLSLRLTDPGAASLLHAIVRRCVEAGDVKEALGDEDLRLPLDDTSELLIDVGRPRQSGLLERAYALIDDATETLQAASQYFPDPPMLRRLHAAARRGVDVRLVVNRPGQHFVISREWQTLARLRGSVLSAGRLHYHYPDRTRPLHAHALASESEGLLSTHNLIRFGVSLGTAEIGVTRRDAVFAAELGAAISQLAAS